MLDWLGFRKEKLFLLLLVLLAGPRLDGLVDHRLPTLDISVARKIALGGTGASGATSNESRMANSAQTSLGISSRKFATAFPFGPVQ